MPNRVIKESIFSSPNFNRLSQEEKAHFFHILLLADDHGCFESDPDIIKGKCYPKAKEVTVKKIAKWTIALSKNDILTLWTESERQYAHFINFAKHQRVRSLHRRKTPEPPQVADKCQRVSASDGLNPNPNPNPNPIEEEPLSTPPALVGLELYEVDEKLIKNFDKKYKAWQIAYPTIDIDTFIKRLHSWEMSNVKNRKKDRSRFFGNRLAAGQDDSRTPRLIIKADDTQPGESEKTDDPKTGRDFGYSKKRVFKIAYAAVKGDYEIVKGSLDEGFTRVDWNAEPWNDIEGILDYEIPDLIEKLRIDLVCEGAI